MLPTIIAIRDIDLTRNDGYPLVPSSWEWTKEAVGWTLYPQGRQSPQTRIYCIYVGDNGTKGLYVVSGTKVVLQHILPNLDTWWTFSDFRTATGGVANQARAVWDASPLADGGAYTLRRRFCGTQIEQDAETTVNEDVV